MTLPLLIRKSLRRHALSTLVTALSIALASGLWATVWILREQAQRVFTQTDAGFDAVLGARGSKLQLVLNALFHLEASPGNIRWADYEEVSRLPGVELAVPLAVGDNYQGWRLVGTLTNLFARNDRAETSRLELAQGGRLFDPLRREAVVGSFAARQLGLRLGDSFEPFHGFEAGGSPHEEEFLVVGILRPSNSPADRVIWVPLAAIQHMSGHDPNAANDLSAVLIRLKERSAAAGFLLDQRYNRAGTRLTFAWPIGSVVAQLFSKLDWLDLVLRLISWLVAVVAGGSVLASLHNSMNERRREIAVLRALGGHRRTVFGAIVMEAVAIAALGLGAGLAIYGGLMTFTAGILRAQVGVVLDPLAWSRAFLVVPAVMLAVGALAGVIPAIKAYRTPVAENLGPMA